jgi:hypothetical protein
MVHRIKEEKAGWSKAQIDLWIENRLAELRESCPDLWQFIRDTQEELFYHICSKARAEAAEESCPAEATQRQVILRILEVIEAFKAGEEIEELERLWRE